MGYQNQKFYFVLIPFLNYASITQLCFHRFPWLWWNAMTDSILIKMFTLLTISGYMHCANQVKERPLKQLVRKYPVKYSTTTTSPLLYLFIFLSCIYILYIPIYRLPYNFLITSTNSYFYIHIHSNSLNMGRMKSYFWSKLWYTSLLAQFQTMKPYKSALNYSHFFTIIPHQSLTN